MLKLRARWTFAVTWLTKLAMYVWEPLVVLGPAALSLLTIPGVFFFTIIVFAVVGVGRLTVHEIQAVRRRRRPDPQDAAPDEREEDEGERDEWERDEWERSRPADARYEHERDVRSPYDV
jgi:hypothetical protein